MSAGKSTTGGVNAAREAARGLGDDAIADAIYERAAGILGLYHVAFYGERGVPGDERRLRDAWRETLAIVAARGPRAD